MIFFSLFFAFFSVPRPPRCVGPQEPREKAKEKKDKNATRGKRRKKQRPGCLEKVRLSRLAVSWTRQPPARLSFFSSVALVGDRDGARTPLRLQLRGRYRQTDGESSFFPFLFFLAAALFCLRDRHL
ncbi:hypothetical protein [Pandoravirus japonicus]|uniref:Uncharacterized protein n=1 Tax=Pandoravirus japonicus TaxID=2823154 RepID=A0A811BQ20_9VIRU|nr:hypothetical protein [Pandoravirus japonicus]